MTTDEHRRRHVALHQALDELLADWLEQTLPRYGEPLVQPFGTDRPIADLMAWSYAQTQHPTPGTGEVYDDPGAEASERRSDALP